MKRNIPVTVCAKCKADLSATLQPRSEPVEQVFAKLKTLLRKAEERTVEAVWKRIGSLLKCFNPAECAAYFRNAGYA